MVQTRLAKNFIISIFCFLISFTISSCIHPSFVSSNDTVKLIDPATAVVVNHEKEMQEKEEQQANDDAGLPKVKSSLDARNAAVAAITTKYGWDLPDTWAEQPAQPIENAGLRQTYTSGPWVVQVEYYASAPFVPEYAITADHMSMVARWNGIVRADGSVEEMEYTQK
jgi:hypothetical protein